MTTRLLENGNDLGAVVKFERYDRKSGDSRVKDPAWCRFVVPAGVGLCLGWAEHSLSFDNGTTVPIRVTRVTGGVAGLHVTALVR